MRPFSVKCIYNTLILMSQRTLTLEPNQYKARITDLVLYRKEILLKHIVSTLTMFLYKKFLAYGYRYLLYVQTVYFSDYHFSISCLVYSTKRLTLFRLGFFEVPGKSECTDDIVMKLER